MLGRLLCGQLEIVSGDFEPPPGAAFISFEREEEILEFERYHDDSNFIGCQDHGTLVRDFILATGGDPHSLELLAGRLDFSPLLERGLRFLSTGELRKALICASLLSSPSLLVLDEPFEGLDQDSRGVLADLLARLAAAGQPMLLLLNRVSEIPPETTHIGLLAERRLVVSGPRDEMLAGEALRRLVAFQHDLPGDWPAADPPCAAPSPPEGEALIEMHGVTVRYGERTILDRLDWTVRPGEHWKSFGPNGSGKSTLLSLVTGDNTQAYANHVRLFGVRKGSGENVWQLKRYIGLVSSTLQQDYRVGGTVRSVVASGFFDSIGVYRRVSRTQLEIVDAWLEFLQLSHLAEASLRSCSFGKQRLALIARAMVKRPPLLILDEPCQGLDEVNRAMVLALLEKLAAGGAAQLLYVTHHPEDHIPSINRTLQLVPSPAGSRARFDVD